MQYLSGRFARSWTIEHPGLFSLVVDQAVIQNFIVDVSTHGMECDIDPAIDRGLTDGVDINVVQIRLLDLLPEVRVFLESARVIGLAELRREQRPGKVVIPTLCDQVEIVSQEPFRGPNVRCSWGYR